MAKDDRGRILQHGGFHGYIHWPVLPYHELHMSDYYLCYGHGVAEYIGELRTDHDMYSNIKIADPVTVGSSSLDSLVQMHTKDAFRGS